MQLSTFNIPLHWRHILNYSRYGGKYYVDFVENLLLFPAVKELWKSVKNWQSYRHEFVYYFGGT